MSFPAPFRILAAAALCIAALIGLAAFEFNARAQGAEVILRMQTIDPRALLSGQYVLLNFQETLAQGASCPPAAPEGNESESWLAFTPRGAPASVIGAASSQEEALRLSPLNTRGSFTCAPARAASKTDPGFPGGITAQIGIDRFYADQTEIRRIETLLRAQRPDAPNRVLAIVSLGRDGRARLKGLMIDGRRVELGWD